MNWFIVRPIYLLLSLGCVWGVVYGTLVDLDVWIGIRGTLGALVWVRGCEGALVWVHGCLAHSLLG